MVLHANICAIVCEILYSTINSRQIFPGQTSSSQVTDFTTQVASPSQSSQSIISGSQSGQSTTGSRLGQTTYASNQRFFSSWPNASVNHGTIMKPAPLRKKHTFKFQPYQSCKIKETWTHEFCVLADRDQRKVPTTSMKQELREAGLGQKSIVFKNKKGSFDHIQQALYHHYPKLKESGGFEFYRQGSGKVLSYIKPPASGYTIPYLKYSYGIKSAIIYVVPIQKNLSMETVSFEEDEV